MQALFYLCPALMDWMVFFVSFAVFYAAGIRGLSMQECGWLGLLFPAAYTVSSLVSGHFITLRNARGVLLAATVFCGLTSMWVLYATAFVPLATGLLLCGVATAWFFNSFQAFMRGEASAGPLRVSVALYTVSWCVGAALGSVTSGWLYRWGGPVLILAVVAATAAIVVMLLRPSGKPAAAHAAEELVEQGAREEYPVSGAYVIIGWLMIFTITFVQRPLFTFLPPMFASEGVSSLRASLPLFIHMLVSAVSGLAMVRFRDSLYRRTPLWIIQGGGAIALCVMGVWPFYWVCFSMLFVLGITSGFAYYCAVYYVNNSGRRSFNIGVNEALVGFGSIAGILAGDAWMRHSGSTTGLYWVCGAGLAASSLAQAAIVFLHRRRMAGRCPSA